MEKNKYLDNKVKQLVSIINTACDDLDQQGRGVSNYFLDSNSKEMCKLSLNLFNMLIAISDGKLTDDEISFINEASDSSFTRDEIKIIIDKSNIQNAEYLDMIPIILRVFVDADNYEDKGGSHCPLSISLYELFAVFGICVIVTDDKIVKEEYVYLIKYLTTIYNFIKKNLKTGVSDIEKPVDFVLNILNAAEVEYNEASLQKNEEQDEGSSEDAKENEEKSLEELIGELNSLTGLEEVKYEVTSLMNLLRVKKMREQMGLKTPPVSMHLVFSGNPGTGKTTVARILAQIYKRIGVLSKGQLVEVDRAGLVGGYVGQTAIKTSDVINAAKGGVLFIDEAYSLAPEHVANDYGPEAIDTLVKAMEDCRDDLIVIVAGYPDLMEHFLASNPGLRSRFNKFINFKDYTPAELTEIFTAFCLKHGYRTSRPALEYVYQFYVARCNEKAENFANAREVRNLFEYAISRQANRLMLLPNPKQSDMTLLKKSDVSGEQINLGKQEYLAQRIMDGLTKEKRHGIEMELMSVNIDELELSAGAEEALLKAMIVTVGNLMDFIDGDQKIEDIKGIGKDAVSEIKAELEKLGFEDAEE